MNTFSITRNLDPLYNFETDSLELHHLCPFGEAGHQSESLTFDTSPSLVANMDGKGDPERADALEQFKNKLLELREMEAKLKTLRIDIKGLQKDFDTTEDNIKALQSVGQIIGEVLKQLDEERCEYYVFQTYLTEQCRKYDNADMIVASHRQSIIRSSLRCWLPIQGRQG